MRKKTGFTLIEVMVSIALLGIGLMLIIELFSGGLRLGRTSQEYTQATHYARTKMEELNLKPPTEEGVEEGEFDSNYRWKIEMKKVNLLPKVIDPDFKPPANLIHVKLQVLWKSGLKEKSIQIESYRILKEEGDEKPS